MENVFLLLIIGVIVIGLASSLHNFWTNPMRMHYLSVQNFVVLMLVYMTILVGFGLVYMILDLLEISHLIQNGAQISGSFFSKLESYMYFSAVTVLTVGYGDIIPTGLSKWVAMLEAMIGYLLPAAFVVRSVIEHEKK